MKVLVTGRLPEEVMALIRKEHQVEAHEEDCPMPRETLMKKIGDKEGLLCMITDLIDAGVLDKAPLLKMIANYGVGYDNIAVDAATARGIPVSNTPGVLTEATADLALSLILATARRVVEGDKMTREGRFRFWAPFHFLGRDVTGKTLGIIGLGRIGKAVARRAKGFDMRLLYYNRRPVGKDEEHALGVEYTPLRTLISQSDFISLHVPLTKETHHLIGSEELDLMKNSAYLINTARGPIVDEKALVEALKKRKIAGAGLDVYEHEPHITPGLAQLDNVVLLPHVGSATMETRTRMAQLSAENLLAGMRGEIPPNCVNGGSLPRPR